MILFSVILSTAAGCMGHAQEEHGTNPNTLAPCPDSPNCVSTKSPDPDRAMSPLPYLGTKEKSHKRLILVLRDMKRCTIITADPVYIHAEFRSALFGFVDDVNFVFDNNERRIHFRSASRIGHYDFGANRKRMKEVSEQYMDPKWETE